MKKLIVDASNVAYRSSFVGELPTHTGESWDVVLGFLRSLVHVMRAVSPAGCVAVFDGGVSRWRTDRLPEYKKSRTEDLAAGRWSAIFHQVDEIYTSLKESMGIPVIRLHGWEAKDLIYYMSMKMKSFRDFDIVIMSSDKSFYGILSDRICMHTGDVKITPDVLLDTIGVEPGRIPAVLSWTGDTDMDIPPSCRVGMSLAVDLARIGVDKVVSMARKGEDLGVRGVSQRVIDYLRMNWDKVSREYCRNLDLIDLSRHPLPNKGDRESIRTMLCDADFNRGRLRELCRKWGLVSILRDFDEFTRPLAYSVLEGFLASSRVSRGNRDAIRSRYRNLMDFSIQDLKSSLHSVEKGSIPWYLSAKKKR